MGKSDKKIKSDRINALKHRYDSFLEEEKKRKERNEYILEKMDKMRSCTLVVPVRNKPGPFDDYRKVTFYNKPEQSLESPTGLCRIDQRRYHIDIPSKQVDETDLLKEISKKYILIPKLPTKYSDYIKEITPNVDDNNDWRTKYEILDQLKRNEKEGVDETLSPSERRLLKAERDVVQNIPPNLNLETTQKQGNEPVLDYQEGFPDGGQSENKTYYNLHNSPCDIEAEKYLLDKSSKISDLKEEPLTSLSANSNVNYNNEISYENSDYKNGHEINYSGLQYEQDTEENENVQRFDTSITTSEENGGVIFSQKEKDTHFMQNEYKAQSIPDSKQQHIIEEDKDKMTGKEMYGDQDEAGIVETINPNELIEELNRDIPLDVQASESVENIQYPIETINVQDFTPHDDVLLEDGVNINPKPEVFENYSLNNVGDPGVTEHVVVAQDANEPIENNFDPIIVTDTTDAIINEISDAGPSEYNEHTDENYAYTQESGVDNYNTEYSAPNENYQQEEYAAYYEGVQAEQAYAQINEHEETDQRYDPNYEQQYGNAYNQESYQQQGYEQEYSQQGYEQPAYSEQQQEYTEQQQEYSEHQQVSDQSQQEKENIQYDNQNMAPQYVEQQLDNEEGYVAPQNEQVNVTDTEQQKIYDTQNVSDKVANKVQV